MRLEISNFIQSIIYKIRKSDVIKNISILASGALIGQAISLLSTPILSRLYGPESYAVLALFAAFIASLAPGISGRYEVAVAVAKNQEESGKLLVIGVWVTAGLSSLVLLAIVIYYNSLQALIRAELIGSWLYLVPASIFLIGLTTLIQNYANNRKDYKKISYLSIVQATSTASLSILFYTMGWSEGGLVGAMISTNLVVVIFLIMSYKRELMLLDFNINKVLYRLAKKYKQFPLYNCPASILDGITISLPVFFLAKDYPEVIVGYFALISRVATAPLAFLSQAVGQVHLRKVADMVQGAAPAENYLFRMTLMLSIIASIPTLIFMVAAPELFALLFGEQWRQAGVLLVIMAPALALKFVVSTLSGVFSSTGNSHLDGYWKILAFFSTFIMLYAMSGKLEVKELLIAMVVNDCFLYFIYYRLILQAIRKPKGFI